MVRQLIQRDRTRPLAAVRTVHASGGREIGHGVVPRGRRRGSGDRAEMRKPWLRTRTTGHAVQHRTRGQDVGRCLSVTTVVGCGARRAPSPEREAPGSLRRTREERGGPTGRHDHGTVRNGHTLRPRGPLLGHGSPNTGCAATIRSPNPTTDQQQQTPHRRWLHQRPARHATLPMTAHLIMVKHHEQGTVVDERPSRCEESGRWVVAGQAARW